MCIIWLLLDCQYQCNDCLERLVPEMTCYVSSETLNSTHSLSTSVTDRETLHDSIYRAVHMRRTVIIYNGLDDYVVGFASFYIKVR